MFTHVSKSTYGLVIGLALASAVILMYSCQKSRGTPTNPARLSSETILLNVGKGLDRQAKAVGLTISAVEKQTGATTASQTFSNPSFPLNMTFALPKPPCNYMISATAVLGDGTSNSASAEVDVCAFTGETIHLSVITEEATPTPTITPTPTPTPTPTITPLLTETPTTITPAPTEMPTPTTITPTPTETTIPPTPTETTIPPTPTETTIPPTPTGTPTCGGQSVPLVNGYCWYRSTIGGPCTAACTGHGAASVAAGDSWMMELDATYTHCVAVLDALLLGSGAMYGSSSWPYGCYYQSGNRLRGNAANPDRPVLGNLVTDPDGTDVQRACACTF